MTKFTAAHRAISNYPRGRGRAIGFVGYPKTDKTTGELTSIDAEMPKGIFWVIDANWKPKGFTVIVR